MGIGYANVDHLDDPVWQDWEVYRRLGDFVELVVTVFDPFSIEICLDDVFVDIRRLFTGHPVLAKQYSYWL